MTRPRPQFQIRNPIEYSITQIKSICLWIGLLTIVSSTWANGQANNGLIFYGETDFRMLSPTGEIIGKSVTGQVPVWAPGHKQFAFKSGTNTITITTVATNTSTSITVAGTVDLLSWTCPDKIIFADQTTILYLTLSDQQSHTIPIATAGWNDPELSPDGSALVFSGYSASTDDVGIFTAHIDGSQLQRLTTGNLDYQPKWSPDGTKIAFVRLAASLSLSPYENFAADGLFYYRGQAYIVNADGSNPHQLASSTSHALDVSWSPDGTQLAVVTPWAESVELWIVSVAGSQRAMIYRTSFGEFIDPLSTLPNKIKGLYYRVRWK